MPPSKAPARCLVIAMHLKAGAASDVVQRTLCTGQDKSLQVYTHFAEALDGLVTIRAFDKQPRFAASNEALVAATQRASIAGVATAQWLALRLQLMTAVIVFLIALLAVLDAEDVLPSARPGRPINVGASSSAAVVTACMSAMMSYPTILNTQQLRTREAYAS